MAVPKKKTSKSKRNMRRSHHALSQSYAIICPNCAEPMLPHRICVSCGHYRGKSYLPVKDDLSSEESAPSAN